MAGLTLKNLSKRYQGITALDDINLEIAPGEFIALLGPSGCGKTTTLRLVAGFELPSSGEIYFKEKCLAGPGINLPPEKRNMAVVFQSYALWPHLSIADNVGYPLKIKKINGSAYDRQVAEALETVSLEDYAHRKPSELSGGQRQRVALARCLVMSPDVVLLDEPLANLDRNLRETMEKYFREFHQQTGAIMLYVTHNQDEAMAMADRIAVMNQGRIEQFASPEVLYKQPLSRVVADFIGEGKTVNTGPVGGKYAKLGNADIPLRRKGSHPLSMGHVMVRPEHVRVGEGTIPARIESCQYRGERYYLNLSLFDGQPIDGYSALRHSPGESTCITVDDAWLLPKCDQV